jgi:hypothetical protein
MGTSQNHRKTDEPFRSVNFSDVMLFRSCAARCWCAGDVGAAVGDVHGAIGSGCSLGNSTGPGTGASRLSRGGFARMTVRVFPGK